jgi:hypothetical protein
MTKTEFETFVRALTDQAISASPHYRQQRMTEFYSTVAEDFIDIVGADTSRLEDFSMENAERTWGGFCAGFLCGQYKPRVGK